MFKNYTGYNPIDWLTMIESFSEKSDKYKLCECDGVWITKNEIDTIKSIQDNVLERLAFSLLCIAKFLNVRNEKNNDWVNFDDSEIFKAANISISAFNKGIKLNMLRELRLIEYAKRIDNLNIHVLFVEKDDDEKVLFINDFRNLGNEWRLYCGENYIRCTDCGKLIRKTSKNKKYCTDCIKENPYYENIGTKIIKCVDCGKVVEIDAKDNKTCRCDECQHIENKRIKLEYYHRNKKIK